MFTQVQRLSSWTICFFSTFSNCQFLLLVFYFLVTWECYSVRMRKSMQKIYKILLDFFSSNSRDWCKISRLRTDVIWMCVMFVALPSIWRDREKWSKFLNMIFIEVKFMVNYFDRVFGDFLYSYKVPRFNFILLNLFKLTINTKWVNLKIEFHLILRYFLLFRKLPLIKVCKYKLKMKSCDEFWVQFISFIRMNFKR